MMLVYLEKFKKLILCSSSSSLNRFKCFTDCWTILTMLNIWNNCFILKTTLLKPFDRRWIVSCNVETNSIIEKFCSGGETYRSIGEWISIYGETRNIWWKQTQIVQNHLRKGVYKSFNMVQLNSTIRFKIWNTYAKFSTLSKSFNNYPKR